VTTTFLHRFYASVLPLSVRDGLRPLKTPGHSLARGLTRVWAGGRVASGLFAGMRFPSSIGQLGMLLGTWEKELDPVWREIVVQPYRLMVNVGAAEGYYAVGLALRCPALRVIAFEMLAEQRVRLDELAALNAVTARIDVRGRCEPTGFDAALGDGRGTLVVMDVEGYETVLLDPHRAPALAAADVLVESHDLYVEGCTELLRKRFATMHEIVEIESRWRTLDDYPFRHMLTRLPWLREQFLFTMNEGRPCLMRWLWLKSRNS
jgi:hypothetical protein